MKKLFRFFRNLDRRILLLAGGGALVVVLIILLIVLKPFSSGKTYEASDVIPDNAFVVFRINNPGELIHNSSFSNTMQNISFLPAAEDFLFGLKQADTVFSVSENNPNLLSSSNLYVSLHPTGKNKTETLFVLELPDNIDAAQIHEDLQGSGKISFSEKTVEGSKCYSIGKKSFTVYSCNNLLIGSVSERLLSLSIKASDKKSGLSRSEEFMKAQKTASSDCALNIFVNTPLLYRSLGQLVSGDTYVNLAFLATLSSWGNLDVKVQNDVLVFSGLFPLNQDGTSFMTLFDEPLNDATGTILSMLPANTSAAFSFGFGNFEKFFSVYVKRLSNEKQNAYNNDEELAHLNDEAETESLEDCLYEHVTGTLCVFSTAVGPGREPEVYCAFPINDAEAVKECLLDYAESNEWDTLNFRDATLIEIPVEYVAYSLFGPLFEPISETCIAVTDEFVFIGNSSEQLKPVLNDVLSGRTLSASAYKQNLKNNISSSWNTFTYLNTAAAEYYLANRWLSDTTMISSLNDARGKKQSGIMSLTCARQSDGIVVSGTWFFGKADSASSESWATTLDADVAGRPVILKDFKTGEIWMAAADVYDNVYLLNSEGVIVWKKEVGDAVNGDFQLLWSGNKEKRSVAFSTAKGIYIIGLDGEMRKSFPISVRGGVASNLLVADYENNQNYRLLFCDNNGVFNNYSTEGKQTDGWLKPSLSKHNDCRVFYSPLGGKDYLIISDAGGSVRIFDRKGKEVQTIDEIQFNKGLNPLQGTRDADFWTSFSSDGGLITFNIEGKFNTLSEKSFGENVLFHVSENQIIVVSEGTMYVLDKTGKELSSEKLSESAIDYIRVVKSSENNFLIFHNSDDVVGIISTTSDYAEKALKTDASAFDCVSEKNKIRLITANGKSIVSEIVGVKKD